MTNVNTSMLLVTWSVRASQLPVEKCAKNARNVYTVFETVCAEPCIKLNYVMLN